MPPEGRTGVLDDVWSILNFRPESTPAPGATSPAASARVPLPTPPEGGTGVLDDVRRKKKFRPESTPAPGATSPAACARVPSRRCQRVGQGSWMTSEEKKIFGPGPPTHLPRGRHLRQPVPSLSASVGTASPCESLIYTCKKAACHVNARGKGSRAQRPLSPHSTLLSGRGWHPCVALSLPFDLSLSTLPCPQAVPR